MRFGSGHRIFLDGNVYGSLLEQSGITCQEGDSNITYLYYFPLYKFTNETIGKSK